MATVIESERSNDAQRKADARSSARDLIIPDALNLDRRQACEDDDCLWLSTYCRDVFYNPFTAHQKKIIADCGESLQYGTQKCKAAPRGDGKSSIVKYLALKYALKRQVRFPLMVAATASKAKKALSSLKRRLAARAVTPLSEDYPLECHVARYVDPWPSRARNVTANGKRPINVEWGADWFILPTWEDTEPLGPILFAIGITSDELQGCNVYDQRPDFVMLDDLDSRDSLASEDGVIAAKIEEAIDKTIAGLGGQSRSLGQFMLATITSRESAAYKYSDPAQKPSFSGERIGAIVKWPDRSDLWDEYVRLRRAGKGTLDDDGNPQDVFGRAAHAHYLANREAMDAGAELSNPYNFEADLLPDGSQKQASSLQRCYDYIADISLESFLTEHQNDPPEDVDGIESTITDRRIQKQVSEYPRRIVPPECKVLVMGIDCGKVLLHWVVRAFRSDGTGFTVDYGTSPVYGTKINSDEGIDVAVRLAIKQRMADLEVNPCTRPDGEIVPVEMTLVDSGYRSAAVYAACDELGLSVMPVKGRGKSQGCDGATFHECKTRTPTTKPGYRYKIVKQDRGTWLVEADADHWKAWEHDRWMTEPGKPGCMYLFGSAPKNGERLSQDQYDHLSYAKQIVAEVEANEPYKGGLRRRFVSKSPQNHFLDASYYADVAAAMKGVRLMTATAVITEPQQGGWFAQQKKRA